MRLNEFTEQPVEEGYYDLPNQDNFPGMEPIDFSSNPSFKELVSRYTQLVYQGHTSETDPEEDQEHDEIEQYVAQHFGEKGSAHLQKAGEVSYWGRDDKPYGRDSRSSNLGRPNQPGGNFRTTKAGKMHGQDAKMMKAKVADRLGRHPEPNLPEGMAEGAQVDSLVTDALKIMKGPELSHAVAALKTVLGDREYNSRRGFYNFYIKQIVDMYNKQGVTEGYGDEDNPVASAITRRILMQRHDLLQKYGPAKVTQAIDDVVDYYDLGPDEEIGSSDVSNWVKQVERSLASMEQGVAESSDEKQAFKVSYHNPKTRQDKVVKIKADNKDEVLDYCANKGYKDVHVEEMASEGYSVVPGYDREKYQERPGLEGPFHTKSGKVVYYDKKEGSYYDPDSDMYISYEDWQAMNEAGFGRATGRASWDSNMPGYQGDYGGAENWGRREREDDEHHEIDRGQEQQAASGTWYITVDGKLLKNKEGQPYKFVGKAAATKAAQTMMVKPFNQGKKFMLTTKGV